MSSSITFIVHNVSTPCDLSECQKLFITFKNFSPTFLQLWSFQPYSFVVCSNWSSLYDLVKLTNYIHFFMWNRNFSMPIPSNGPYEEHSFPDFVIKLKKIWALIY